MLCWTFHTLGQGQIQRGSQSQHQSVGEAQTEEVFVSLCDLTAPTELVPPVAGEF